MHDVVQLYMDSTKLLILLIYSFHIYWMPALCQEHKNYKYEFKL